MKWQNAIWLLALIGAMGISACAPEDDSDDRPTNAESEVGGTDEIEIIDGTLSAALVACGEEPSAAVNTETMVRDVEVSVFELVQCGRMRNSTANSVALSVLVRNEAFLDDDINYAVDKFLGEPDMQRDESGSFTAPVPIAPASDFRLWFHHPETGEALVDDPFHLESYLAGAKPSSSHSVDDILKVDFWNIDPSEVITITVPYDGPGPLFDVLARGEELSNPLVIEFTVAEAGELLLGAVEKAPWPFSNLRDVPVRAHLLFVDESSDTNIVYEAEYEEQTAEEFFESGSTELHISTWSVEMGATELLAEVDGLQMVGDIVVDISGVAEYHTLTQGSGESEATVLSDYGVGSQMPSTTVVCGEKKYGPFDPEPAPVTSD